MTHVSVKRGLVLAVHAALAADDVGKAEEILGIIGSARPGEVTPYVRAHAARLAARIAALRGMDDATVEAGFAAAERQFRALGMPWDLANTLVDAAEWLAARVRADDAERFALKGREIITKLDARPSIERASRLIATGAGLAPVAS